MSLHLVPHSSYGAMEIEGELIVPGASVRLMHYHFPEPPESKLFVEGRFRIELCLTTRHQSARACYRDFWNAQRFERLGALCVLPPSQTVIAKSDERRSTSAIVCEIDAAPILQMYENQPEPADHLLLASLDFRDTRIRALLLRLAEEARHPGFASEVVVESVVTLMSVELFRAGVELVERSHGGGLAPWQLRRIDERLEEAREAPTLALLAELCRISVRQLTRGFRASRGSSLGAYVAASQMEHAKRLLMCGDSVTVVAGRLGFSASSTFCFAFRRAMGMSPGEFQRMLRV